MSFEELLGQVQPDEMQIASLSQNTISLPREHQDNLNKYQFERLKKQHFVVALFTARWSTQNLQDLSARLTSKTFDAQFDDEEEVSLFSNIS
jgi:hypothetical protein